jgi:hypothetical protein
VAHTLSGLYSKAAPLKVLVKREPPVAEIDSYVIATRLLDGDRLWRLVRCIVERGDDRAIGHCEHIGAEAVPVLGTHGWITHQGAGRRKRDEIDRKPSWNSRVPVHRIDCGSMSSLQQRVVNRDPGTSAERRIQRGGSLRGNRRGAALDHGSQGSCRALDIQLHDVLHVLRRRRDRVEAPVEPHAAAGRCPHIPRASARRLL